MATPYALGNVIASGPNPVNRTVLGDVGGDIKYSVTPSLALDGTVNTDFAQVEVDDQQVNLDRFNLFFPEKRPFFLENAGFFTVGNPGEVDLFFSRRIGLADNGDDIPIVAGGRLSGKAGQYNIGVLEMQTVSGSTDPSNNFAVVRVSRDLPNRSSVGGLFVNRQGFGDLAEDSDFNRTFALDGKLGIGQNTVLSSFVARTQTPGVESGGQHAFNVRSRTNLPLIDLEFGYQEVGERFNPEVGFLSRSGYRKPDARINTRIRPKDFLNLQEVRPHVTYRAFWGFDGFQETSYTHIDNHLQFKNAYEVHTGLNLTTEGVRTPFRIYPGVVVSPGTYRNAEAQLVFMTNQGAPLSLHLQANIGGIFGGETGLAQPDAARPHRRQAHLRTGVRPQRRPVAGGRFHHQPRPAARVVLVHHAIVPAGPRAVQRPGRPLVDEFPSRMAPGGQHRPVHRLQRHPLPLRSDPPARTDRPLPRDQVQPDVRPAEMIDLVSLRPARLPRTVLVLLATVFAAVTVLASVVWMLEVRTQAAAAVE